MEYTGDTLDDGPIRKYKRARVVIDHAYQPWRDNKTERMWHKPNLGTLSGDNQAGACGCQPFVKYAKTEIFGSQFPADFIEGKGEGQIFLLHGPPGVGKTLTAECVAEYTRRPLISITAGDLGHEPKALEASLDQFFRQGTDRDAIGLLDEADVYIEARTPQNLERNSIVSIFLRTLDYYQGILFLTTNRVGSFDPAFSSRIHVQLHYPVLDDDVRTAIWDSNFKKLREDTRMGVREIQYDYDAKEYVKHSHEVKALQWNGREIRNKAGENKTPPKLTERHLSQVVRMSQAFKDYIKSTKQTDESQLARQMKIRDDSFGKNGSSYEAPVAD
ncbi:hypothetical protein VTN77DRAFT_4062 [Rasamsonia byssochlamydoides]|uniref:uncharacterized protein n=1 Tax=Rasamsonia byssochlamydoides TaxID=89139 RepID=UPI003744A2BB